MTDAIVTLVSRRWIYLPELTNDIIIMSFNVTISSPPFLADFQFAKAMLRVCQMERVLLMNNCGTERSQANNNYIPGAWKFAIIGHFV